MRMSPITRNAAPVIAAAQAATDFVGVCFAQCVFRTSILFRAGLASLRRSSHYDIVVLGSIMAVFRNASRLYEKAKRFKGELSSRSRRSEFRWQFKSLEFRSWGEGSVPPNQGVVPVGIDRRAVCD